MHDKLFENPVFVESGPFTIREIASVNDALDFLDEWPDELRDLVFQTIHSTCLAAHDGRYPVAAAREAFAKWARRANIAADDAQNPAWMLAPGKTGYGGLQA
jgi:hypothetical protein